MARRKNRPETVRVKCYLSERLREIRTELYGERGGSEMARQLGVPIRTWYNYESGVTVPAEVLLKFMELTSVEPLWLLHGRGPKFRTLPAAELPTDSHQTVRSLLRTALQHLERQKDIGPEQDATAFLPIPGTDRIPSGLSSPSPDLGHDLADAQQGWLNAECEGRCLQVADDSMAPIVAQGARVAFSSEIETATALDGQMVVAWIDGEPKVRWLRLSGSYGLLRAENPDASPSTVLVDLSSRRSATRLRRVLWIGTPH